MSEYKVGYLFLDIETTGKNRFKDQIWSVSNCLDIVQDRKIISHETIITNLIQHNRSASPWVLNNTDYLRYFTQFGEPRGKTSVSQFEFIQNFLSNLEQVIQEEKIKIYLVGANPSFDDIFLSRSKNEYYPEEEMPYDYHLIDIENMFLGKYSYITFRPPSLKTCFENVFDTKLQDNYEHSSENDTDMTRKVFYELMGIDMTDDEKDAQ